MAARKLQIWMAVLAIPVLLGASYPLQLRIDRETPAVLAGHEELLLASPRVIRKLSLGYEGLLADVYWTRAVQYYGSKRRTHDSNFPLLQPLLEISTALDPQLLIAYKFGAIFLAEPAPRGAGRPDVAVQLVREGIANNPNEWRMWADLGFIYYYDLHDYKDAAQAYLEGSKNPQARDWMKVMAARIAQEGGSRDISRFLWAEVYQSSENASIRKNAYEHLQALRAEDDMEHLDALIAAYRERTGHLPSTMRDLVAGGVIRGVPIDPTGYPYVIGRDGHAQLNPESKITPEMIHPSQIRIDM